MLDLTQIQTQMRAQADAIHALVRDVAPPLARWRPDADSWSIVEVVNHLADEEREDFRRRLDLTLHRPEADWPPIDPAGWVEQRGYRERDLAASLQDFMDERQNSLEWLAGLESPPWAQVHTHPDFGSMSAGELMAAWLAHDLLHLRQLIELRYAATEAAVQPFSVDYAGGW